MFVWASKIQSAIHVLISLIIISCMSFAPSGNPYMNNPAQQFSFIYCILASGLEMPLAKETVEEIKVCLVQLKRFATQE